MPIDISGLKRDLAPKAEPAVAKAPGGSGKYIAKLPERLRKTRLLELPDSYKDLLRNGTFHHLVNKECMREVYPYFYSAGFYEQQDASMRNMNRIWFGSELSPDGINQGNVEQVCSGARKLNPDLSRSGGYPGDPQQRYRKFAEAVCRSMNADSYVFRGGLTKNDNPELFCQDPEIAADMAYKNCAKVRQTMKRSDNYCQCVRAEVLKFYQENDNDGGTRAQMDSGRAANRTCMKVQ